jgi:outer membrane biosynthesis protein TonB
MATDSDNSIEALLEQRAQYEQWLAKLESAANKAPEAVRRKVRADYEVRLRGVIERLRGHAATIAEELQRHQASQGELDAHRRDAEEELAEAEVRHTVGEFSDDDWRRISEESERKLSGLREQLKSVGGEIARLVEVQSLIAAPTKPAAPAPPPQEQVIERSPPPPPPPPPADRVAEAPAQRATPRPTPTPSRRESEPAGAVDELAFLKSVADEPKPAASRRPSNPGAGAPQGSRAVETAPAPTGKAGASGVAKTLKCGECGTLNRPTEWYCERCGAELAGI